MKEGKTVKLYQAVTDIGDDLIEEAGAARARKKIPAWRWGAIAACLCLALVGTAAAVTEYVHLRIEWRNSGIVNIDGYTVEYPVDFYPVEAFSQEVRDLAAAYPGRWMRAGEESGHRYFDTWDEVHEFIGLDLFRNPVLDSAEPGPTGTRPWEHHRDRQDPDKTHLMLLASATDDGELYTVWADGDYLVDGVYVGVNECIYTEQAEGDLYYPAQGTRGRTEGDGYHARWGMVYGKNRTSTEELAEVYTTPNGLTATIVKTVWATDEKDGVACCAYFLIDGVQFEVTVAGDSLNGWDGDRPMTTPEHAMEILKAVLDGFEL